MKRQQQYQLVLSYTIVIVAVIIFLFPIVWLSLGSFKQPKEILQVSLPKSLTLTNYRTVIDTFPIGQYLRNSLLVAVSSTTIALVSGSLAAYGFARSRYRFHGQGIVLILILTLRMLPGIALGIPLYLLFSRLDLIDRPPALIFAHAAIQIPLVIWIMKGFFEDVPVELEEAGMVDGSSRLGVLYRIVLPLATPGLAVAAILAFLFSWNEFSLALILSSSPKLRTMPVALSQMNQLYGIRWDLLSAAATLYIVPTMIMALLLQRYIVRGLTMGSVKG